MVRCPAVFLGVLLAAPLGAQIVTLAPEIVTATRTPQPPAQTAVTVRVVDDLALRQTPSLTLDGQLRALPAFSLFRRSEQQTQRDGETAGHGKGNDERRVVRVTVDAGQRPARG